MIKALTNKDRIDLLNEKKSLSFDEWKILLSTRTDEDCRYSEELAVKAAHELFGNKIYFRGIIEFTNICKNDCFYCGIRKSNCRVNRYRLTPEEILTCCQEGYELGYRTFVLQGGEDSGFSDALMTKIISDIRLAYPDCAITLSIGEKSSASYKSFFNAGANRYLLRHETADSLHYSKLHPSNLSLDTRIECLKSLKSIGYQTGCGMMVGSPYQSLDNIARDMVFLQEFKPHMIGMGPFIPHSDTPFKDFQRGSTKLTLFLLSLSRIMLPNALIPATTALDTAEEDGRIKGILAGCNVIMPNLSPLSVRKKYLLYDNKAGIDVTPKESLDQLKIKVKEIGYEMSSERGDYKPNYY